MPPDVTPPALEAGPAAIFLAAVGPVMLRTAGAVADGVFVHPIHTCEHLHQGTEPALAAGLAERLRAREDLTISVAVLAAVGAGEELHAQRERARRRFAFYASTPAYRPVLEHAGWGGLADELRLLVRRGDTEAMARAVPDQALDAYMVSGETWSAAAAAARRRYAGVADRVAFQATLPIDELLDG